MSPEISELGWHQLIYLYLQVDSDGITVIDLTDPSNPAYCFMLPPNIDIPRVSVPSGVPLSATEYLRVYYPVPNSKDFEHAGVYEFEGLTRSTIDALREERIVTLEMLAEAWPDEYEAKLRESRKTEGGGDVAVTVAAADSDILIPSLVEMTMKPALRHSLEIGDTYDIEELVWMPGRGGAIKSLLRDQSPFPDTGVALLIKIIETEPTPDEAALDLTGFQLSAKQVLTVLSEVEHPVEILNLSDNIIITVDDIKHILLAIPSIRRLFLLGTSIPTEDLNKLLTDEPELFTNIEAIIHPAFLQWNGKGDASYPNAFAFVGLSFEPTFTLSFPFFTPSSIVKCLTDFLSGFTVQKFATYGLAKSTLVPQSAFASLRDEDKNWSERFVPLIPQGGSVLGQRRGWAFLFDFSMPPGEAPKPKKYAFVKLSAPGDDGSPRIHHFRSFLDELTREGRCRPFSIAINRLDDIFRRLGASLMTEEDVRPFAMGTDTDLLV